MESHHYATFTNLDETQIKLPSNAYPLQKRMVKLIMEAISKKKSLVIESPTGTGKTMCLLSATLEAVKQKGIKRVYYLTKTHTQMNGIVNEIRNTSYEPDFVIAQSKKALCVHQPAIIQGEEYNIQQFNGLCYQAQSNTTKARDIVEKCPMKIQMNPQTIEFPPFESIRNQRDIKLYSQQLGYCPERYQTVLSKKAELLIMPYIYMMNEFIFQSKKFDLEDSVLLFDEAHNILEMAQAQSSTLINERTIEFANKQLSTLNTIVQSQMIGHMKSGEAQQKYETLKNLFKYLDQLSQIKDALKKFYEKRGESIAILSLTQIKSQLKFSLNGFRRFRQTNRSYLQDLSSDLKNFDEGRKRFYITAFINVCYQLDHILNSVQHEACNNYVCAMYKQGKYKQQKFKIKFHCMTSKPVFDRLNYFKSSFIFASGTLNIQDFKETGLSFINHFSPRYPEENPYPNNNVQTFVVSEIHHKALEVDFRNPNYDMVAHYLKAVAPSIKNGILVFFKSYSYLTEFHKYVVNNYYDFGRPVFFEQRVAIDFQEVMTKYKKAAEDQKGAILFGCMRGKASEGCNFENAYARAVFIIGMPFNNINSIDSQIHRHINDFQPWYNGTAMLGVNQAIGRVVRHQKDYGLVFLLGKKLYQFVGKLPDWLKHNKIHENMSIDQTNYNIKRFFNAKIGIQVEAPVSSINNYEDSMNEQMLQMWNGQSDNQNQDVSYSTSKQKYSNKYSSPIKSERIYPQPKKVKIESPFTQTVIKKQYVEDTSQYQSADFNQQQQIQLLLALERSKREI